MFDKNKWKLWFFLGAFGALMLGGFSAKAVAQTSLPWEINQFSKLVMAVEPGIIGYIKKTPAALRELPKVIFYYPDPIADVAISAYIQKDFCRAYKEQSLHEEVIQSLSQFGALAFRIHIKEESTQDNEIDSIESSWHGAVDSLCNGYLNPNHVTKWKEEGIGGELAFETGYHLMKMKTNTNKFILIRVIDEPSDNTGYVIQLWWRCNDKIAVLKKNGKGVFCYNHLLNSPHPVHKKLMKFIELR